MGLIKTAIISGVAIYGVNKIAKSAENKRRDQQSDRTDYYHRDSQTQARYRDMGMMDEGYYHAPPSQGGQTYQEKGQPRDMMNFVDRRSYPSDYDLDHNKKNTSRHQHQQQPLYIQNDPYAPLPASRNGKEYTMYGGYDDGTNAPPPPPPPPQYEYQPQPPSQYQYRPSQRYQRSGFVEPDELSQSDLQSRNGHGNGTTTAEETRGSGSSMLNGLADFLNGDGKKGDRSKDLKRMSAK
ncbi:hypothetical protein RBB50_004545 [Rhinocladiella similis]